jgi:chaperonin GroES
MLTPIGDAVLIKQKAKEQAVSILIIPDDAKEASLLPEGEIVSVGEGDLIKKYKLEIGKTVFFNEWGGELIKYDGQNYKLLKIHDILAVL